MDLVSVRDASLGKSQDTSWFENEWMLIEPRLTDLTAEELALGLLLKVEEPVLQDVGEQAVADHKEEAARETQTEAESSDPLSLEEQGNEQADTSGEALVTDVEPGEETLEPEEPPLWLRYRNWYTDLLSNCFAQIDREQWRLATALRAVERSSELRVIMHAAWIQPIGGKPQAVLLHGGDEGEVGVLRLARRTFVQAEVNMWRPLASGYAQLHEARAMRLARAYYFDHPLMGVILRVDPLRVPAEFR